MLEVTFSCPLCSRMFLKDCPYQGGIPKHLDALLGKPCSMSDQPLKWYLEIPPHPHLPSDQELVVPVQ